MNRYKKKAITKTQTTEAEENEMPKIFDFFKNETCILFHNNSDDGHKVATEVTSAFDAAFEFSFSGGRCFDGIEFKKCFIKGLSEWLAKEHQAMASNG